MRRTWQDWAATTILAAGLGAQLQATRAHDGRRATNQGHKELGVNCALELAASEQSRLTDTGTPKGRSSSRGMNAELPAPLTAAIMLLGWFGDDVPRIEVVDTKPPDASATVDAWVRFNEDGSARPIIYVRTDTDVYRFALQEDYQALVRLAGILAHERWHLRHGRDEVGAYTVQLATMEYLHANSMHLAQVRRALRMVEQQEKKRTSRP